VFRYSQEEETAAGTLPGQVPEEVKQERWHRLMKQQSHIVRRKNLALVGSEQEILVCDYDERGRQWGRSRGHAPEIDGVVFLEHAKAEAGDIIPMRISGVSGYDLRAKPIARIRKKSSQEIDLARLPL